jgi:hypothetical protein
MADGVRRVLAAAILKEALSLAAEDGAGLVDRVVAMQAAYRVRADIPTNARAQLDQARLLLISGLEALGDTGSAYGVAAEGLAEASAESEDRENRKQLTAAIIRLAQEDSRHVDDPLVQEAVATAATGGAAVSLEARVWAAVDLLRQPDQLHVALNLLREVTDVLHTSEDLGEPAERWRLLLAFHAGRAGYPMITQELLGPMVDGDSTRLLDAANAIIHAVDEPHADTRLQNLILEAELDAGTGGDDETQRLHHALAANYARLGDYRWALEHAHHELELLRARQMPVRAALAVRLDIAYWTSEAGDLSEALRLANELLPDQLQLLGQHHAQTLANRSNIALWKARLGQAPALPVYQQLLSDVLTFLGPRHAGAMTIRYNIAITMARSGNLAEANRILSNLLHDQIEFLGPHHEKTLAIRAQLANTTDDPAEAVRLYNELIPELIQILGPGHPETIRTRRAMAVAMAQDGDIAGSLRQMRELLTVQVTVHGPDYPETLFTRREIAVITGKRSNADALRLLRELLPELERVLGAQDPLTRQTIADIATLAARSTPAARRKVPPNKLGKRDTKSKGSTPKTKRKRKK